MISKITKAGWSAALFGVGFATIALAQAPQAGPPFNVKDRNAGNKWMTDNHIDRTLPASNLMGFTGVGAMFRTTSSDTAHQVSSAIPRFIFRQEYYGPKTLANGKTSLSWSADYDINCRSKVSRVVAVREYAAHNLSGEAVMIAQAPANAPYTPVAQDPVVKDIYDDICNSHGVSEDLGFVAPHSTGAAAGGGIAGGLGGRKVGSEDDGN